MFLEVDVLMSVFMIYGCSVTCLHHSLSVVDEVGGQLVFRGSADMSHSKVDSTTGSMNVQVRRTC